MNQASDSIPAPNARAKKGFCLCGAKASTGYKNRVCKRCANIEKELGDYHDPYIFIPDIHPEALVERSHRTLAYYEDTFRIPCTGITPRHVTA